MMLAARVGGHLKTQLVRGADTDALRTGLSGGGVKVRPPIAARAVHDGMQPSQALSRRHTSKIYHQDKLVGDGEVNPYNITARRM